ncbi:MAG: BatD family protein [Promethearchaeota archaeon]
MRAIISPKKLALLTVVLLCGAILSVNTTTALQYQQNNGVNVEKTVSEELIGTGDRLNVTITINNENSLPIQNVELIDTVPDAFLVVSGSLIEFWTSIDAFESINHTYILEARNSGNYTLEAAELNFELAGESFTVRSNTVEISIETKLWTPPQGSIENPSAIFLGVYILPVIGLIIGVVIIARKKS